MDCVLLCKSYRSSILTYDCDSERRKRECMCVYVREREKMSEWMEMKGAVCKRSKREM